MVAIAASNGGGAARVAGNSGAQGQLGMLSGQIKTLLKKLTQLQKQLMNATGPADRMALIKEIADLELDIQLLQEQVAQIEQNEQQKAQHHAKAQAAMQKDEKKDEKKD